MSISHIIPMLPISIICVQTLPIVLTRIWSTINKINWILAFIRPDSINTCCTLGTFNSITIIDIDLAEKSIEANWTFTVKIRRYAILRCRCRSGCYSFVFTLATIFTLSSILDTWIIRAIAVLAHEFCCAITIIVIKTIVTCTSISAWIP